MHWRHYHVANGCMFNLIIWTRQQNCSCYRLLKVKGKPKFFITMTFDIFSTIPTVWYCAFYAFYGFDEWFRSQLWILRRWCKNPDNCRNLHDSVVGTLFVKIQNGFSQVSVFHEFSSRFYLARVLFALLVDSAIYDSHDQRTKAKKSQRSYLIPKLLKFCFFSKFTSQRNSSKQRGKSAVLLWNSHAENKVSSLSQFNQNSLIGCQKRHSNSVLFIFASDLVALLLLSHK